MKKYQNYYEREFLAVFLFVCLLIVLSGSAAAVYLFVSGQGAKTAIHVFLMLFLLAFIFLIPVLIHVFIIYRRKKIALAGERKLSEISGMMEYKFKTYVIYFKYRNARNRTCEASVSVPYDIYMKMSHHMGLPIYVNGNYAYINMSEIEEICSKIKDTKEFKYIDERKKEAYEEYDDEYEDEDED